MKETISFEPVLPLKSLRQSHNAVRAIGRGIARLEKTFTGKHGPQNLTLLGLLAGPPIGFLLITLWPSPRQMWAQRWPTMAFVGLFQIALRRHVEIEGLEHLPKTGPVILAGNHVNKTAMDGMLLGSKILTERRGLPKFVSVAQPPDRMLRHFVKLMGENDGVLLPIHKGMTTAIIIQFLRNPKSFNRHQSFLGIFPVGAADRDFEKHIKKEWHTSAAIAALETGALIVPFFLEGLPYHWGPFEMLKAVGRSLVGAKAFEFKIRLGPPIRAEGGKEERNYRDIMERVRQGVIRLAEESIRTSAAGSPGDADEGEGPLSPRAVFIVPKAGP